MCNYEDHPLISVGIPFYNNEKYLSYAIQSVIMQSYANWELILVDDGSTDKSFEIAKKFQSLDKRIKVISDGENKKLPTRLNQLIDESKGQYIARMDADDIMHPDRLFKQFTYLNSNRDIDIVSSGLVSIDSNNCIKGYRTSSNIITNVSIDKGFPIVHPSVMARKNWFLRNKYNESFPRSQDYELWCRSFAKNDLKIAILPELLLYYREEGVISVDKLKRSYIDSFKIYTKYSKRFNLKKFSIQYCKVVVVFILDKIGYLQKIVNRRNNKVMNKNFEAYHNNILLEIKSSK
ncbi:glycosyltransferase family 2 protein [Acinetobacter lwoffii]|uniref:glycosyltransferase family 2 protein n=1 Tax=Acinetobacter lwoffii TaxID=28090 RepID=UPI0032B4307F